MKRTSNTRERPAAATVEFAVLVPFLLFLCVIATDWARLLYFSIALESCARNGALYASDADYAAKSPYTSVTQAALAEAPNLGSSITVDSTPTTDSTGKAAHRVTVTMPFQTLTNFPGVPKTQVITRSVQMRQAELLIRAP